MQVRAATTADVDGIVGLKALIMTSTYPFEVDLDARPDWAPRAASVIMTMLADDHHAFFVADSPEGGLAGCISVTRTLHVPGPDWGPWHAQVGDMCTAEAHRGQGLGRQLMAAALDWCRSREVHTVTVQSTPSAVPIYQRLGFTPRAGAELFPSLRRDLRAGPDA